MFLKSVEIFGFKSFPDRTKIELSPGISALIGPNGCGKSNVVDSIKWVLGEQSSKTLRASRMEDVIFNGTETRKPLNVAEITLTISNDGGVLPMEIPEIAIKRRLYRSGESEYFINNQMVKLKELRELFFDTGVGKSAYSIMEQGKIDQVLSNKPEERRYIFEEAAGITKYKVKGQEAERKMQKTEENLKQVEGILGEVKRSHDTLKIQADKTTKYRDFKNKIFDVEVKIQLLKLKVLLEVKFQKQNMLEEESQKRTEMQSSIDEINKSMETNIDLVNNMEARLIDSQKKLYGIEIEKNNKTTQIRILIERKAELERKIELDRSRENSFKEKIKMFQEEVTSRENELELIKKHIEEVILNASNFEKDINLFHERIKANDSEISVNENKIREIEAGNEDFRGQLREITDDIVTQLDSKLKETGYSISERQKTESLIQDIINTLKIQLTGKANILGDIKISGDVNPEELERFIASTNNLLTDFIKKIEEINDLFDFYKKATPSFIDEFLAPEGIITKKREIDNQITLNLEEINVKRKRNDDLKQENKNLISKIDEYRKTLQELNINKARKQTQASSIENDIRRLNIEIKDQVKLLEQNTNEIMETINKIEDNQNKILIIEKEREQVELTEAELAKNLSALELEISSKNKFLMDNEKKLKDKMGILLKHQSRLEKIQMELTEANVEIKNVYANFTETHSRDLAEFETQMHEIQTPLNDLKNESVELKNELKKCGQVNLMAVEEYSEVKERYDFLTKQIDDLKKAKSDLERITTEIQNESAELFLDTYNKIKKNFHIIFRRLFGGGRGELKLTDPSQVLESGIEILAQPPGKKLESIHLLSGGERSMTGVALLFATYMVKPSPFCILDEIDAALDEENVSRFIHILKEFAANSQFIIITHNKRTIAGAETLLGITMEESGVSRIITVRIKSKELSIQDKEKDQSSASANEGHTSNLSNINDIQRKFEEEDQNFDDDRFDSPIERKSKTKQSEPVIEANSSDKEKQLEEDSEIRNKSIENNLQEASNDLRVLPEKKTKLIKKQKKIIPVEGDSKQDQTIKSDKSLPEHMEAIQEEAFLTVENTTQNNHLLEINISTDVHDQKNKQKKTKSKKKQKANIPDQEDLSHENLSAVDPYKESEHLSSSHENIQIEEEHKKPDQQDMAHVNLSTADDHKESVHVSSTHENLLTDEAFNEPDEQDFSRVNLSTTDKHTEFDQVESTQENSQDAQDHNEPDQQDYSHVNLETAEQHTESDQVESAQENSQDSQDHNEPDQQDFSRVNLSTTDKHTEFDQVESTQENSQEAQDHNKSEQQDYSHLNLETAEQHTEFDQVESTQENSQEAQDHNEPDQQDYSHLNLETAEQHREFDQVESTQETTLIIDESAKPFQIEPIEDNLMAIDESITLNEKESEHDNFRKRKEKIHTDQENDIY